MMSLANSATRYGAVTQSFHWLTVLLVGAAYLLGEGGPESRIYAADRAATLSIHETLGVAVFVVVLLRLIWRAVTPPPREPPMPVWMAYASRAVHWLLYALLIAVPLTAILGAWFEGHPVTLVGGLAIGPWTGVASDLGHSFAELHETLGNFIIYVAGIHAAAALFHHFVLRDSVLAAMLPWRSSRLPSG